MRLFFFLDTLQTKKRMEKRKPYKDESTAKNLKWTKGALETQPKNWLPSVHTYSLV